MANQRTLIESMKRRANAAAEISHETAEKRQRTIIWIIVAVVVLFAAVASKVLSSDGSNSGRAGIALQASVATNQPASR